MKSLACVALSFVLAILLAIGCTKASESSDAKRMPKPPPGPIADGARELRVEVEIDGIAQPAIDAAKLAATPPDFKDDEHRAWRIGTLLGANAARPRAAITVTGAKDVAVTMRNPAAPSDPIPVFSVNRRGDAIAELVSPDQPFPAYHGQGGRLSRPGDPMPRIVGVTKIAIATGDAAR